MGRMANSDINDTVPFSVDTSSDGQPTPTKKKRSPWKSLVLLGILALILIAATSGYAGYAKGITNRKEAEAALSSSKAAEQFDLAIVDIGNEQYQHARQRLEYVAHLNPNYPGLTEKLAEVLARINATWLRSWPGSMQPLRLPLPRLPRSRRPLIRVGLRPCSARVSRWSLTAIGLARLTHC
ncbi:MAG: hypothetical protein H6Q37_2062 [Chloroflexi bacterium]|nr:hypothetical protein [Chloroflexota bacterium]